MTIRKDHYKAGANDEMFISADGDLHAQQFDGDHEDVVPATDGREGQRAGQREDTGMVVDVGEDDLEQILAKYEDHEPSVDADDATS